MRIIRQPCRLPTGLMIIRLIHRGYQPARDRWINPLISTPTLKPYLKKCVLIPRDVLIKSIFNEKPTYLFYVFFGLMFPCPTRDRIIVSCFVMTSYSWTGAFSSLFVLIMFLLFVCVYSVYVSFYTCKYSQ